MRNWICNKKPFIPSLFMVLISTFILLQAVTLKNQSLIDPAGGSFFPAFIAILMWMAGLASLIKAIRGFFGERPSSPRVKFILFFIGILVVYILLIPVITFYPATLLFLLVTMYFLKEIPWRLNITVSLASIFVIYLLFTKLFNILFP